MAPQVGDRPPPPHMCVPGPSPISAALPATARLSPSRWDPGHGRGPARPGRRSAGRASPPWLSAFCSPCFLQPPLPRLHPPPRPQWDCAPANSVRAGSTALQYSVPDPLSLSPPGLCREGGGIPEGSVSSSCVPPFPSHQTSPPLQGQPRKEVASRAGSTSSGASCRSLNDERAAGRFL